MCKKRFGWAKQQRKLAKRGKHLPKHFRVSKWRKQKELQTIIHKIKKKKN